MMYESDSAIMALGNLHSGDNIIIKLREHLARNQIQLLLVSKKQWAKIVEQTRLTASTRLGDQREVIKYIWPNVALRKERNIRLKALQTNHEQGTSK